MNNYRRLNLPQIPVKNVDEISERAITGGYNLVLPREVLTDELMDIFHSYGLRPSFVSLFGRQDQIGNADTRMIHTDIQLVGNDRHSKDSWKKLLFGINWEILGSQNTFSWWDMSAVNECWPAEPGIKKYDYLNGIHYVKRGNLGIPTGAVKIEETLISGPTLVSTSVPHMTEYLSPNAKRVGISVRFDESQFKSWDEVTEFFKPLTI